MMTGDPTVTPDPTLPTTRTRKTLVVGPAMGMRGGINTVIATHAGSEVWNRWGCIWIESVSEGGAVFKLLFALKGFLRFLVHLPGTDIVHIHLTFGSSALRKRAFFEVARLMRIPVIVHLHAPSFEPSEESRLFAGVRSMFRRAQGVIALSRSWESDILRNVPEARTIVLPNCVDLPAQAVPISERKKSIFYSGKLESRKGYRTLLEGFASIAARIPDWKLEFAGNGQVEQAREYAEELGVADQTTIHGWVERPCMLEMLGNAQLFCLPSFAEGFPMSVLEALAAGCAVVTTPVGGLPDELEDGKDVLFFPPGNPEALAACLLRLAHDPSLVERLSLRGRELSSTRFSNTAMLERLDGIYRRIVG